MTGGQALAVAVLGGGGSLLRHLAARRLPSRWGVPGAPAVRATALVNVVGSAVAGLVVGSGSGASAALLLVGGFCGGLTTYGTWALEVTRLAQARHARRALLVACGTAVACVAAAAFGRVGGGALLR